MPKKLLIDCDPGIGDAVALAIALFEPRLEVLAITATEGVASAELTSRNVQGIVDRLDPPKRPRVGRATELQSSVQTTTHAFHGSDGLANCGWGVSRVQDEEISARVICDVVREDPEEVTILTMGPLTNLARAFELDPELPMMIGEIVVRGGSVDGIGNETACAEYNMYFDPQAADEVFRSPSTKTVVPLDITSRVVFPMELLDQLPSKFSRAGELLDLILPFSFRAHHQLLGLESIYLHDVVALMAVIHPEMFRTEPTSGQVETLGEITRGVTVFDRRPARMCQPNMEIVTSVDAQGVRDYTSRALQIAGKMTI